jgi:hypothetical protein
MTPLCHPLRPHAALGLCRSCYKRKHHPVPVDVASRMRAVREADARMEFEVFRARAEGFGSKFYDEILLRAMRRRKDAAARIDAEWSLSGEDLS